MPSTCKILLYGAIGIISVFFAGVAYMCYSEPIVWFEKGSVPKEPRSGPLLSKQEVAAYRRDGFILKRGLVSGEELDSLQAASKQVIDKFFWTDIFFGRLYGKISLQTWRKKKDIAQFAFESNLPSIAAQLLNEKLSIRILKDAIFCQVSSKKGCGFHVDDKGFWPADRDSNGVTFWIALSQMRKAEGGAIRVVKGGHRAKWATECREVIANQTCNMKELSPTCHERLLESSVTHDMEPGDAIIWDRWTFHRGDPFLPQQKPDNEKDGSNTILKSSEGKMRYTIRYIPSHARAEGRHHRSVKTGDRFHGPFYPQVWPGALEEEIVQFSSLGRNLKDALFPFK